MMKSKLLVAAIAAFMISPLALANGYISQTVTSPFDGPYLGIGAGVQHNVANAEASYNWETQEAFNQELPTSTGSYSSKTDKGLNTIGGTVFGGWGHTFGANKTWYLAGELYVRYAPSNGKYTATTYTETSTYGNYWNTYTDHFKYGKVRTNWFYGIQAKGGYLICPHTLFYFSIGAETTRFHVSPTEYSFQENSNSQYDTNYSHTIAGKSFNHWGWAPVPGVGFMTVIHHNWILGGQYTYAFYGPFSSSHSGSFVREHQLTNNSVPTTTENYTLKTKIKNVDVSQFLLTLAYRFDV